MTVDELRKIFDDAYAKHDKSGHPATESGCRSAGVTAIVRALRDEMGDPSTFKSAKPECCGRGVPNFKDGSEECCCQPDVWLLHEELLERINEIPGIAAEEKVAEFTGGMNDLSVSDAAPAEHSDATAVCVWTGEEYVTYSTSCESEHEVDPHKAPPTYCPSCGKPIVFTEASHG